MSNGYVKWFMFCNFLQESYDVFADLLDPVIYYRHNGYDKSAQHRTDLNPDNLVGGDDLDPRYVLSCRVRTGRSIKGLCLPPVCTRAERKKVEKILTDALSKLEGPFEGIGKIIPERITCSKLTKRKLKYRPSKSILGSLVLTLNK